MLRPRMTAPSWTAPPAISASVGRQSRLETVWVILVPGSMTPGQITAVGTRIELSHMLADNCAMQLIRNPGQFDVVVTDNLFGDLLSDCAAMITGSLGMLPSASLGSVDSSGKRRALYEPVHGSAPDIAGQGIANPLGAILSVAMMLRFTFNDDDAAQRIETAVEIALSKGARTQDIAEAGSRAITTSEMGDAVLGAIDAS